VSTQTRVVGATVVAAPSQVHADAEVAFSPVTGLIDYLGPVRGPAGPGDLDGTGRLVAPGLINAHTHAGMSLLRGHRDDQPLQQWLTDIRAFELRMTRADIRAGLLLSMAEMIRSGTVGFADMYLWDSGLLADVHDAGMRLLAAPAVFGYEAVGYPAATPMTGAQVLDNTPALAAEFAGDPLIGITYGPHAPYSAGANLLRDVAGRMAATGLGVHIHLSETAVEVRDSLAAGGRSPIAMAAGVGLFDGRAHVAHAVHPEDGDHALLARPGVTVSYNPVSNLKLGAGIAPAAAYLAAGVTMGVGTDSMASNNSADLFEEIKFGALLQRGAHQDPALLAGADTLRMATSGGAAAFGRRLSGRLAVGEPADLIVLDTWGSAAVPMPDPVSHLGYAARGGDVTDVFVAGRRLLAHRRLTTLDEPAIRADAVARVSRIRAELTLPRLTGSG
jgi:5-methylthioadenosine/S-adenosylhomocysteine deaminase